MTASHLQFEKRVKRLHRRHERMARDGVVHAVGKDGLIMSRPRRNSLRFPVRGVVWLAIFLFTIKAFLLYHHGPTEYNQRVSQLVEGTAFEKAGAFVLDADPVSGWLASQMTRYLSGATATEDAAIFIVDEDL